MVWKKDFSDSLGKARLRQLSSSRPEFVAHPASAARATIESPFDRFARLKHELKRFQDDLDSLTKDVATDATNHYILVFPLSHSVLCYVCCVVESSNR
jgi:hypothetical protein